MLDDMAGNTHYIQEKSNIHIGFFWLYGIAGVASAVTGVAVIVLIKVRKRKQLEREE